MAIPGSNWTAVDHPTRRASGHDIDTFAASTQDLPDPSVLKGLDLYSEHRSDIGVFEHRAQFRGLRFRLSDSLLRIDGSLAAFVMGSNAEPFEHGLVRVALGEVADVLALPVDVIRDARVTRLHIGVNVPMPVAEITGAMIAVPPFRRQDRGRASTSVGHTTRAVYIYDKRAQRGTQPVHDSYGSGPLARVELQYNRNVAQQLRRPVTLGLLADRSVYEDLGDRLMEAVEAVPLRSHPRVGMPTTPTELCRAYAPIGIEADRGFEAVFADIDTALARGELTPNQASALRCTIRHMITKGTRRRAGPGRAADFYHAVRSAVYGTSS